LTELELLTLKAKYGPITLIRVEDTDIYYRSLTPNEITVLSELESSQKTKDWVEATVALAVIEPKQLDFQLVGSMYVLHEAIMNSSIPILKDGSFDMEYYDKWADGIVSSNSSYALAAAIVKNFPNTDILKLLDTPMERLLQIAALVEKMTGTSLFNKHKETDPAKQLLARLSKERSKLNG